MKYLKNLNQKKLAQNILCGLLAAGSLFVGMQQAYAGEGTTTYISGAYYTKAENLVGTLFDVWLGDETKDIKISDKGGTNVLTQRSAEFIYGVYNLEGEASGANITVDGGSVPQMISGGFGHTAIGNTVTINNAQILNANSGGIEGGSGKESAYRNIVNITGNTITQGITGGYGAKNGNACENIVNISGGVHYSLVDGGVAHHANYNIVNISDGQFQEQAGINGGNGGAVANHNIVNISGGTQKSFINGGNGTEQTNYNIVNINGGTQESIIVGGSGSNETNHNIVNISGGTQKSVIIGGDGEYITNHNIINISGGTQKSDVIGGYAEEEANNNTVNLIGKLGKLEVTTNYNESGEALKKTIEGKALNIAGVVYGSYIDDFGKSGTGNALHVAGKDISVRNIANFQSVNFYIQSGLSYGDTMLTVTGNEDVNLTNTDVKVEIQAKPQGGDKGSINLIEAPNAKITETKSQTIDVEQGKTLTFKGRVERQEDDKKLVLIVDEIVVPEPVPPQPDPPKPPKPPVNENGKSLLETRAAAAAVVNAGADFMVDQGLSQAKSAAMTGNGSMEPFAAMGGSKMKVKTGSYVDMNGWNGALGLAKKVKDVTFGVAVEHGKGNYDSYLDNGFHAKGDVKATGGVLFADMQKANGNHFDVAIRAGKVKTDYNNDAGLGYDDSVSYFGAIIGAGHEFKVGKKASLDVYGRYFWNRTADSEVIPDTDKGPGNLTKFDAVNSSRLRLGTRYTHNLNDKNQIYAGLAWQYEFNGDANGTIYSGSKGYSCPAPGLKGHSGMAELGYKFEASKNLSIDLSATGWTGKQKGVAGGLNLQWKF